ncbi:MAG: 6-phosphogluconolactonase [Cyanobacteriota bacterium]|nr:6-phosphogluconolactonase [Cyanobacteriota bacterium]
MPSLPTRYQLIVAGSPEEMARRCAETIAARLDLALDQRDRAQIALAGGGTPRATYQRLGGERLPWERVDVLLGDERWVAADDPASNARMIGETLLMGEAGSQARFHPVPTHLATPEQGAQTYAELLQQLCPGSPPRLDVVLLGLGDDGHTASLFPGTAACGVADRWVTVGEGKGLPRITCTVPVLSAARQVLFLVSGAGKRQALQRLLDPDASPDETPAKRVAPDHEVVIVADEAAADGLA